MAEYAEMFHQHTEPQIVDSSAYEQAFGTAPTPPARTPDATPPGVDSGSRTVDPRLLRRDVTSAAARSVAGS